MAYGDFKDLTRKIVSDKILCNKAFNIAKTPKYDGYHRSSIVNEGIRAILNLFIIFFTRRFHTTKSLKSIQANKNKKDSIFMRIKTSKRKKIACLTFCAFYAFYAHKKHLRGGKSLVCVLCFLCFLCFL